MQTFVYGESYSGSHTPSAAYAASVSGCPQKPIRSYSSRCSSTILQLSEGNLDKTYLLFLIGFYLLNSIFHPGLSREIREIFFALLYTFNEQGQKRVVQNQSHRICLWRKVWFWEHWTNSEREYEL